MAFLFALRRHLQTLLRKESSAIRALRGPNELREAADAGRLVVSVQDECQVDIHYHHVSYVRYQPLRPVLLRMAIVRPLAGADASELGAQAGKIVLRLAHALAGHWFFVLDFSAYFWVDLKKPQTLQLLHIEKTTLNQEELVIEARPFRGGARLIWRGHTEKVPDTFDWEKEDRVSKKDADDGGSESSSTSDGEEDDGPNKKSCGAPEPAASRHAPKPPASSRHQQRRGSNQDWVRPLVLGHVATKVAVPEAIREHQMNRITRASTGETNWVARYWGEFASCGRFAQD